ncbi:hypothetical protein [Halobacterium sp. KA-6]|uniref:hypothetical protein n=1 Tax=Halobacterium sp. KA-6 TaxID=2896368 RepID=UPI001E51ACA3|nr:hypothetical protein [Halobacterium sp. KA-6]MCD2205297.1 hypothetical protein [Halobacterium sp. KA-6]
MSGDLPDNISYPNWVGDDSQTNTVDLNVHIFGPYRGEYQDLLLDISSFLREEGYNGAAICSELPNHDSKPGMGESEQNWWESVNCLFQADAAIFLFLDPREDRLNGAPAEGLNSSVFAEFVYWCNFFSEDRLGAMAIFEGGMENYGSLIQGLVDISGMHQTTVESGEIARIKKLCLGECIEWASQI